MRHYPASNLTPGHPNSLQNVRPRGSLDWTGLVNDEICHCRDGGVMRVYQFIAASTDAESIPDVVIPTGNTTGMGRWHQIEYFQAGGGGGSTDIWPLRAMANRTGIQNMRGYHGLGSIPLVEDNFSMQAETDNHEWQATPFEDPYSTALLNGNVMSSYQSGSTVRVRVINKNVFADGPVTTEKTVLTGLSSTWWTKCATLNNGNVVVFAGDLIGGDQYAAIVDYLGNVVVPQWAVNPSGAGVGDGGITVLNNGNFMLLYTFGQAGYLDIYQPDGTAVTTAHVWAQQGVGEWPPGGSAPYPYSHEKCITLINGNVLIVGGDGYSDGYAAIITPEGEQVTGFGYIDLGDFIPGDACLLANGRVAVSGKWAAPGTGYPAYFVVEPNGWTYVKAVTNLNTVPNGNTGSNTCVEMPDGKHWGMWWSNGEQGEGWWDLFDEDGIRITTTSLVFYDSTVNGVSGVQGIDGRIYAIWQDGTQDARVSIYKGPGIAFENGIQTVGRIYTDPFSMPQGNPPVNDIQVVETWEGDIWSGQTISNDAGIGYGAVLFLNDSGEWERARANGINMGYLYGLSLNPPALTGMTGAQILIKGTMHHAYLSAWTGAAPGEPLYLSTSAWGRMTQTQPSNDWQVTLGCYLAARHCWFDPDKTTIELPPSGGGG